MSDILLLFVVVIPVVIIGSWYLYKVETALNKAHRKELIKEIVKEMKDKNIN